MPRRQKSFALFLLANRKWFLAALVSVYAFLIFAFWTTNWVRPGFLEYHFWPPYADYGKVPNKWFSILNHSRLSTYKNYCRDLKLTDCGFHDAQPQSDAFPLFDFPLIYKWFSSRPLSVQIANRSGDISIVTQMSVDRLEEMRDGMCFSWNGPISLTVFVRDSDRNWESTLRAFVKDCPQIEALSVMFGSANDWYPINHLRNIALQQTASEFVFLIDSDFMPSFEMYETLRSARYQRHLQQYMAVGATPPIATVIVALETPSKALWKRMGAERVPMATLFSLFKWRSQLYKDNDTGFVYPRKVQHNDYYIHQFHVHGCGKCHKMADYSQWFKARFVDDVSDNNIVDEKAESKKRQGIDRMNVSETANGKRSNGDSEGSSAQMAEALDYEIHRGQNVKFEPYVIVRREGLHRYDARFRGYGKNKITHFQYLMKCQNYQFRVLNFASVTTVAHGKRGDSLKWSKPKGNATAHTMRGYNKDLVRHVKETDACIDTTGFVGENRRKSHAV